MNCIGNVYYLTDGELAYKSLTYISCSIEIMLIFEENLGPDRPVISKCEFI